MNATLEDRNDAIAAVTEATHKLIAARDALLDVLQRAGSSFVVGENIQTLDDLMAAPLGSVLAYHRPDTLALLCELDSLRTYIAEDGAVSSFEFGFLVEHALPDIRRAYEAWLEEEQQ